MHINFDITCSTRWPHSRKTLNTRISLRISTIRANSSYFFKRAKSTLILKTQSKRCAHTGDYAAQTHTGANFFLPALTVIYIDSYTAQQTALATTPAPSYEK